MPSVLLVVLAALAVFRLTRLIVADVFPPILWAREWVEDHGTSWMAHLVTCHWCASFYVSVGVVALLWLAPGVAAPVLAWAGLWGAGALVADWQAKRDEQPTEPAEAEPYDRMETLTMSVGANGRVEP